LPDGQVTPDYDPAIGDALRHVSKSMGLVRLLQKLGVRRVRGIQLNPWDNYRKMDMPVLLVRGAISDLLTPQTLQAMQEVKPDLEIVSVPGRGHAPTLAEPVANAAIDAFLARVPKA
jgi:pimeloyl-ACP methyl ester carboxylesterase